MAHPDAFLRHVEPLQGLLTAFARRRLDDPGRVPDVLQAALAIAFAKFSVYEEGSNFRAWILRILELEIRNVNRDVERQSRMQLPLDTPGADVVADLGREFDYERLLADLPALREHLEEPLHRAVAALPCLERGCLLLRALAGLSYREIGVVLDIPEGSAMGYISRARSRLRRELAGETGRRAPGAARSRP